jgi:hypothetical protein
MSPKIISCNSQKRAAQMFNLFSVVAIILMPLFPILMLWIAASILVYSSNIFHPNHLIRRYTKYAGYRFYGFTGALLATMNFSGALIKALGSASLLFLAIWLVGFLVVVPLGIFSIHKAGKEHWKEIWVE